MICQTLGPTPGAFRSGVPSPVHLGPAHGSGQRGPCLVSGLERGGVHSPRLPASPALTPSLARGLGEWRWILPGGPGSLGSRVRPPFLLSLPFEVLPSPGNNLIRLSSDRITSVRPWVLLSVCLSVSGTDPSTLQGVKAFAFPRVADWRGGGS